MKRFKFNFPLLYWTIFCGLLLGAFTLAYMAFGPIDVIKNSTWSLTVSQSSYRVHDTIPVHVVADKLRPIGGTFIQTIECQATTSAFTSYHIADSYSNRAKGHVVTDVPIKVPDIVPNLPATCRIAFVIEYKVYSFRQFSEYNFTNTFTLLPALPQKQIVTVEVPATEPSHPTADQDQTNIKTSNKNSKNNTAQNSNQNSNTGGSGEPEPKTPIRSALCKITLSLLGC